MFENFLQAWLWPSFWFVLPSTPWSSRCSFIWEYLLIGKVSPLHRYCILSSSRKDKPSTVYRMQQYIGEADWLWAFRYPFFVVVLLKERNLQAICHNLFWLRNCHLNQEKKINQKWLMDVSAHSFWQWLALEQNRAVEKILSKELKINCAWYRALLAYLDVR